MVGKARIDLPKYRLRGLCRIYYSPEGLLRVDFHHSSLFGAVEEDVTFLVGDSLLIYDRREGRYLLGDSSRAVLEGSIGEKIEPSDILYAMLLFPPRCRDVEDGALRGVDSRWELSGRWRGREIEMRGERGEGPIEFTQCFAGGGRCYVITYGAYEPVSRGRYPRRLRIERENGTERIDLELSDVRETKLLPSLFDPRELDAR